jgi:hypothetical protein
MMTRFQEVIAKTAASLELPYEVVFEHIMDIAQRTQNQLENPKTMEVDLFGIGALEIRYSKALRKQIELKNRIAYARRHEAAQTLQPATLEKRLDRIEVFEEILESLDKIVKMKGIIKDSGGRQLLYAKEKESGNLFEREPYFPKYLAGHKPLMHKRPLREVGESRFTKKKLGNPNWLKKK